MNAQDHTNSAPRRELVLASAGSGKTYRISSRIIELLARGEEPRSILASTFTRKAAGEILQRVLVRLARAAMDEGEARQLSRDTLAPDSLADRDSRADHEFRADRDSGADRVFRADRDSGADREFWAALLRRTISELHRLNISTLDSFFVRSAQAMAHDLGLPPRWSIADDPTQERVRAEALDGVLEQMDTGRFLDLLRALNTEAVRRSVHERLAEDIEGILAVHRAIEPGAPGWHALAQAIGPRPDDFEVRVAFVQGRLADAPPPLTKTGKPDKRWTDAITALRDNVHARKWVDLPGAGLGKAALTAKDPADAKYYGAAFPDELLAATLDALALARIEIGRSLAARAEAMGELAATYEASFRAGLLASGRLAFEDVTRTLVESNALGQREALGYRMDGAAGHLLLDEFQDTSMLQYRALVPLADGVVRPGQRSGSAIVVADPKQSIYGWRGAAPVVVRTFGARYDLAEETLTKSWRSSQVVLDAVNRVFSGLGQSVAVRKNDGDPATVAEWSRAFAKHESAKPDLPGHVILLAGPAREGRKNAQPALSKFAAERIAELHARAPGRSIGVLVRSNAEVARIIFELGRLGVPASEEGGTTLLDSAGVVTLLALLRLVDHPGDGLARYHVASTPLGEVVGLTDWNAPAIAHAVARRWRRRLVEDGFGRTLAALAQNLEGSLAQRDRVRVRRLVELGYAWDASSTGSALRVDDFVRRAETERAEAPGENPVRVMTFHGSKGLEFDAVVLPQLHGAMIGGGQRGGPVGFRPGGVDSITHAFPPVNQGLLPLFKDVPELADATAQRRADRLRDALGVLYVGMTRARYALHLVFPADAEARVSDEMSSARILRETLPDAPATDPVAQGEVIFEAGDPEWMDTLAHRAEVQVASDGSIKPRTDIPVTGVAGIAQPAGASARRVSPIALRRDAPRTRGLDRRAPSAPGASEAVKSASILGSGASELSGGSDGARKRGTVVHAWLESLEWLETGLAREAELTAAALREAPDWTAEQVASTVAWLRDKLAAPEVAGALSRREWPSGTTVERELPFLWRDGDELVEGFIDRLVLIPGPDGSPAEAIVFDYKTDRLGEDPVRDAEGELHYRAQLRTYERAVQTLYRLPPGQVHSRLLFLDSGRVVMV